MLITVNNEAIGTSVLDHPDGRVGEEREAEVGGSSESTSGVYGRVGWFD
jgi:hypothetical protein